MRTRCLGIQNNGLMMQILQLVSKSRITRGNGASGDLVVMLMRWLGRLGGKRAQCAVTRGTSNMGKLTTGSD